jgi:hypothetical protein
MLIFTPSCRLFRTMEIEQLLQFSTIVALRARWYNKSCKVHVHLRYSNMLRTTEFSHCWITIIENYYPTISPYIKASLFMLSLSLLTMSYVDKKIDRIFVRNTFLCACDKRKRCRSISVQGEGRSIFLSTDDIVNEDKDRIKRNTLISGEINLLINRWHCTYLN